MSSSNYFRRNQQHPRRIDPFVHYEPIQQQQQSSTQAPVSTLANPSTSTSSAARSRSRSSSTHQTASAATSRPQSRMEDSNIIAIPHHPPLPRNVSGVFPGPEPPYISSQASKSSTNSRDSASSSTYSSDQPLRLQQQQQQQHSAPHQHGRLSYPPGVESHARSTYRPRASSGIPANYPSEVHPVSNASLVRREFSVELRETGGYSNEYSRPTTTSRRDSVVSHSSTAASNDIGYGNTMPAAASGMFTNMPPSSTYGRSRRASISSNISDMQSSEKNAAGGDRKYVCDWPECGQAFDRVEHLNRHKRRHTGEKPYRCLVSKCTKLFSRFDNMMQHVGIHCIDGVKTEVPNIKNLNSRCNGRGRVRRTSYRGTQDSYEKFRRHVESSLGSTLAECCILPTKNPDFSNLTLRPLLNDSPPATIAEDTPLCESVDTSGVVHQAGQSYKRSRCDSVVDGMDKQIRLDVAGDISDQRNISIPSRASYLAPHENGRGVVSTSAHQQHTSSGGEADKSSGGSIYNRDYGFSRQESGNHRSSVPSYPSMYEKSGSAAAAGAYYRHSHSSSLSNAQSGYKR
ncbi:hypothetical protein LPJ53_000193 [Coemansia erecta]|uniref:C2H2-type domain-containing protein n=1 Tax=Coemansia erecta TaxID=147472 RepID=A0A9W7Y2I5_9FUNG|nr:hypothetical protein LPJ53_000193 [Coemansia erecta]